MSGRNACKAVRAGLTARPQSEARLALRAGPEGADLNKRSAVRNGRHLQHFIEGALRGIPPLEGGAPETGLSRVPVRGKAFPLMTSKTVLRASPGAACFSDTARDQTFKTMT